MLLTIDLLKKHKKISEEILYFNFEDELSNLKPTN
jgi:hypothetical protein